MKVLGENAKVEIRANFYNLFNNLNLDGNGQAYTEGIETDIMNSHFGRSQTALGARIIELQPDSASELFRRQSDTRAE